MRRFFFLLALLFSTAAFAVEPGEELSDPAQEARAQDLLAELRCMVCQNESIAASPSPFAEEVRAIVREQIVSGRSDDEIRDYLATRYDEEILYRPRMTRNTFLLWLAPFFALIGVGAGVFVVIRNAARQQEDD